MNYLKASDVFIGGRDAPETCRMSPGTLGISKLGGKLTLQLGGAYYLISAEFDPDELRDFLLEEIHD